MRVKLTKDNSHGRKGDVVEVSKNVAFGLIDSGQGIISKDITSSDEEQAGIKNGKSTKLRTHKSS